MSYLKMPFLFLPKGVCLYRSKEATLFCKYNLHNLIKNVIMCSVMFTVCSNHLKISQCCSFLKQAMLFLSPYNQYSLSTPLTRSMTAGKTTAVLLPMWWVCCNITPTSSLFTFTSIFNMGSWLRCHLSSTPHTHTHLTPVGLQREIRALVGIKLKLEELHWFCTSQELYYINPSACFS